MQNGMRQLEAGQSLLPSRHSPSAPANSADVAFDNFWRILRRRRGLIIAWTLALTTAAVILTVTTVPRYQSTASVNIGSGISDVLGTEMPAGAPSGISDGLDYTVTLATQTDVLTSDSLAYQVTEQVGLEKQEDYRLTSGLFGTSPTRDEIKREYDAKLEDAPLRRELITKRFAKNLKVASLPGTRILQVSFLNPDPQMSAKVVNTLVNDYLDQYFRNRYSATAQVSDWMSKQLNDLKAQVESEQKKLLEYQKQAGILGADETNNVTMTKLEELNRQYTTAQANRILAETVYQVAKSGDPELISNTIGNNLIGASNSASANSLNLIQSLRSQQAQLKMQYAQAATKYGSAFPTLVQMRNQLTDLDTSIQAEVGKLRARTENDYRIAKNSEEMLGNAFNQQKAEANRLNDAAVQYTLQKHEVEASRKLYDDLSSKLKEAGVLAGLRSTNITIVDPARTSSRPARPRYPLNIGLGVISGLFIGVGLAFLKELTNQTVRTTQEMEQISSLPSLGILPDASRIGRKGFLPFRKIQGDGAFMLTNPSSYVAEAFRSLRTSVLMSELENPPQVIMVTSALPGEGKTTTSTNAAISLAQQGSSVLLIEADLRKPQLAANLNIPSTPGLSDLVSGRLSLGDGTKPDDKNVYVKHPKVPNLFVLPAGGRIGSPADLMGSSRMKEALENWQQSFDFIVIDTPPLLSVTDAVILSQFVDAVVLVARYGQTSKNSLLRARDLLLRANAKIAGVVMNKVDVSSPDHYQSYGFYGSDSSEEFHYAS